ncbi:hypothetical protein C9J12_14680 [Photobacterium frigidiphilum]|uniref:Uncharacterized protein n=1 Tax=Photobacterium frigidiphilum TaxID=264736 RepID=A0A2T3JF27_9GAMM|nr:hypothetical protein [Photobacterium frigidiphilum]PSU47510.1 hypothetical protein C9J12_14680 [Photobacterium frigidiphilum]
MGLDDLKHKNIINAAKVLAVLVATCLLRYVDSFTVIFSYNQVGIVPSIVAVLVLISGICAIAGLFRGMMWGFIPLYFFIPAATMFFGISIIPFLPSLISPEFRSITVLTLNSIVLLFAVFLLLRMMDSNTMLQTENS